MLAKSVLAKYKLAKVFFLSTASLLLLIFAVLYWYSVPLIKQEIYKVELNASRLVLNNVFELANKMRFNLQAYQQEAIDAHKQNLQSIVTLTASHIRQAIKQGQRQGLSEQQALKAFYQDLRDYQYGNHDYIWIADGNYHLLSHPDERFHQTSASQLQDAQGELIIPKIIDDVLTKGQGFYRYQWHRLGQGESVEKISYVKYFPQWNFFVGTGVYLDDIQQEVSLRRDQAILELRQALKQIVIAKTGYLFVFDEQGNMLAHPNPNIDETNALNLKDPVTGQSILQELKDVADTGLELAYKWDRPTDADNYSYDKLSLVRHLEGFGWYICSSVYVDELQASSQVLSQRILAIGIVALLVALFLAFTFSKRITRPISQLALVAKKVSEGDLTAKANIQRQDEFGLLANTFDDMVDQLKHNIDSLDFEVAHRTQALQASVLDKEQTQQQLELLQRQQRRILEAMPAQIAYLDKQLNYLFANQKYCDFFTGSSDVTSKNLSQVIGKPMMVDLDQYIQQCLAGEEVSFNYTFKASDSRGDIIAQISLIPDLSDEQIIGFLMVMVDITAQQQAQITLLEAQRMNSVGQLSGGLAHDFNNILTVIMGNLSILRQQFIKDVSLVQHIDPALRAAQRGSDITSRLLAFSRRQSLTPELFDIELSVAETLKLIRGSISNSIDLKLEVDNQQTLLAYVDEGQFENCLINLILNAKDSIISQSSKSESNSIVVNISLLDLQYDNFYGQDVLPGCYIQISISDSGAGFSDEALQKGFEPFFTTKSSSEGSGLGLSMVYGFIKQSKGYIRLNNNPTAGACVQLLLPQKSAQADNIDLEKLNELSKLSSMEQGLAEKFSGKLLLLVEDNGDVRDIIRQQLLAYGFNIIEAEDADEAESLIESLPEIYALLSDISMPGRYNGFQLVELCKARHKQSRCVLMTGYDFEQHQPKEVNQTLPAAILQKPFVIEKLITLLS